METLEKDWTIADKDGIIHIPDELDPLFNKLGMQLRFHVYSDKNEIQTIADYICSRNGGDACVREVIEMVLKAQEKWFLLNE